MKELNKIDLHIHTEKGLIYNGGNDGKDTGKYFSAENLIKRNRINDFDLISITNHNKIDTISNIKTEIISSITNTNFCPGIELDLFISSEKRYHIIIIFSENTDTIQIQHKLGELIEENKNNYVNLSQLFELVNQTECILIPHGIKTRGITPSMRPKDTVIFDDMVDLVKIIKSAATIGVLFEYTNINNSLKFSERVSSVATQKWLSVKEFAEIEDKIGARYTASDYRFASEHIRKETKPMTKIWSSPTFRGLQLACIFSETRIWNEKDIINKSNWISRIEIKLNNNFT